MTCVTCYYGGSTFADITFAAGGIGFWATTLSPPTSSRSDLWVGRVALPAGELLQISVSGVPFAPGVDARITGYDLSA